MYYTKREKNKTCSEAIYDFFLNMGQQWQSWDWMFFSPKLFNQTTRKKLLREAANRLTAKQQQLQEFISNTTYRYAV